MVDKKVGNLRVLIVEDYDALSEAAAGIIAKQIFEKPDSVLGLATGSTPVGAYQKLVELYKDDDLDFSQVMAFNLDEYFPIAKENEQSYDYFMKQNLFDHVNVDPAKIHIPSGEAADAKAECALYEETICKSGGIDLQLLGLGLNGHIGFNEPDSHFPKTTQFVELAQSTIDANKRFFDDESEVPRHAITMGIGTIFNARSILLLISGEKKAEIAKAVISGKIDPQVPGSILQLHGDVTVILDEAAGKYLL
ncbi:MAG: glucosamine-6-phosphate deaminase [Clostridiales bacterium]|nr:glucosamine-6-phosphate deaminase [Clostridiales bacterium]